LKSSNFVTVAEFRGARVHREEFTEFTFFYIVLFIYVRLLTGQPLLGIRALSPCMGPAHSFKNT